MAQATKEITTRMAMRLNSLVKLAFNPEESFMVGGSGFLLREAYRESDNGSRGDERQGATLTCVENRYPVPRTVWIKPSKPWGSSALRRRRMCTSMVRSST